MITLGPATRIFLAVGATDMRKSFEGLSSLVKNQFKEDPLSGHLYIFANRNRNRLKVLYWDGSGTWVCAKRLPKGRFAWPRPESVPESRALRILAEELTLLLSGIDLEKTRARNWWRRAA
jgi:transposase